MYAEFIFDDRVFSFGPDAHGSRAYELFELDEGYPISEFLEQLQGRLPRQSDVPDIRFYFDADQNFFLPENRQYYPMPEVLKQFRRGYSRNLFNKVVRSFVEVAETLALLEHVAGVDRAREYWVLCNEYGRILTMEHFECIDIQRYPSDLDTWGFKLLRDTAYSKDVIEFLDKHAWYIDSEKFAEDVIQNDYMTAEDPVRNTIYIYRD